MKKRALLGIIIIVALIIAAGLVKIAIDLKDPNSSVQMAAGKVTEPLTYKIYDDENGQSFDYSKRGYYVNTFKMPDSPWFYIISMGEKSSGGYSIKVNEVNIDKDNNVEVIVKETSPKSGETVTTVLTYPTVCIEFNKKPTTIKIVNTDGEVFKALNWE